MDFYEIRRRTIVALFSDDALVDELVLKGGNAISLIYGLGHRASLDLDFSIETDFEDVGDTARRLFKALEGKFDEVGFTVFDTKFGPRPERVRAAAGPRWGGYQLEFKLIEESGRRRSRFRSEADQDSGGKPITHSGAKPINDSGLKAIINRPRAEW